jgi:hypothetical protein
MQQEAFLHTTKQNNSHNGATSLLDFRQALGAYAINKSDDEIMSTLCLLERIADATFDKWLGARNNVLPSDEIKL